MDELEWVTCNDPARMLAARWQLGEFASQRQLRLFACGCVRRILEYLPEGPFFEAIQFCEDRAEGHYDQNTLAGYQQAVADAYPDQGCNNPNLANALLALRYLLDDCPAGRVSRAAARAAGQGEECREAIAQELAHQAVLMRHIVGSPFHRVTPAPDWPLHHSDVAGMLRAVAHHRQHSPGDLAPVMILSDALEENGFAHHAILQHLRQDTPGGHPRGCWAIDLLLGLD